MSAETRLLWSDEDTETMLAGADAVLGQQPKKLFKTEQSASSIAVRQFQRILNDMNQQLHSIQGALSAEERHSVIEGIVYKKASPFRHMVFWRHVRMAFRAMKKLRDSRHDALHSSLRQKLATSTAHAPCDDVVVFVAAGFIEKMHRMSQVRIHSLLATDELLGHLQKEHWLGLARVFIGFLSELSADCLRWIEVALPLLERTKKWIEEHTRESWQLNSWLHMDTRAWLIHNGGLREDKSKKADSDLLYRLLSVTESDVVTTRVNQAMKAIDEARSSVFDMGEVVKEEKEVKQEDYSSYGEVKEEDEAVTRETNVKKKKKRKQEDRGRTEEIEQGEDNDAVIFLEKKMKKKEKKKRQMELNAENEESEDPSMDSCAVMADVSQSDETNTPKMTKKRKKKQMLMLSVAEADSTCTMVTQSPLLNQSSLPRKKKKKK